MRQKAVARIHEEVLPDQCGHGGHDEEGRDDKDPHDTLAPHWLIQQHCQKDAEDDGDDQHAADDHKGGQDARPEGTGGDEAHVVLEADPVQPVAE